MPDPVERMASLPIGVIVERRALDSPWQDHAWVEIDVSMRCLTGSAPLELHRRATDSRNKGNGRG